MTLKQSETVLMLYFVFFIALCFKKYICEVFNIKSKHSKVFDANFFYKYTCSINQSISYIGETSNLVFRWQTIVELMKTAKYLITANPIKIQVL